MDPPLPFGRGRFKKALPCQPQMVVVEEEKKVWNEKLATMKTDDWPNNWSSSEPYNEIWEPNFSPSCANLKRAPA